MIREDCTIEEPSKPGKYLRLCWNPTCRRPLPKRARKWCEQCAYGSHFYAYHHIGTARLIVIRAACQEDHHALKQGYTRVLDMRYVALHACKPICSSCGVKTNTPANGQPEVDHIEPMEGDDRTGEDCRHHPSNLRVLCHRCHRVVSANQARSRAAGRRGQHEMQLGM